MSLARAFPKSVREVRLLFCQTSQSSAALRSFVNSRYADIKAKNPNLPFMIREAQGTPPRVFIRLEKGQEVQVPMTDAKDATEVEKRLASSIPQ